jgi:hypothetical protein
MGSMYAGDGISLAIHLVKRDNRRLAMCTEQGVTMIAQVASCNALSGQSSLSPVDPEFASRCPPLGKDELAMLECRIQAEGCLDALVLWHGHAIFLDGHNRLDICRRHGIPFNVLHLEFPDRTAGMDWIVEKQLAKRNVSSQAASYLRGMRYLAEKQAHGGDRLTEGASSHHEPMRTAQRLAMKFNVGHATISRDGKFAAAVEVLAANCGPDARKAILARDTGLARWTVIRLARRPVEDQQQAIQELIDTGKLSRGDAPAAGSTFVVSLRPTELANKVYKRLGRTKCAEVLQALGELVAANTDTE